MAQAIEHGNTDVTLLNFSRQHCIANAILSLIAALANRLMAGNLPGTSIEDSVVIGGAGDNATEITVRLTRAEQHAINVNVTVTAVFGGRVVLTNLQLHSRSHIYKMLTSQLGLGRTHFNMGEINGVEGVNFHIDF